MFEFSFVLDEGNFTGNRVKTIPYPAIRILIMRLIKSA